MVTVPAAVGNLLAGGSTAKAGRAMSVRPVANSKVVRRINIPQSFDFAAEQFLSAPSVSIAKGLYMRMSCNYKRCKRNLIHAPSCCLDPVARRRHHSRSGGAGILYRRTDREGGHAD